MINIALLRISGAIFHQVPTKGRLGGGGAAPRTTLSTAESPLDPRLELFLCDRLKRTFTHAAQPIVRDDAVACPTPDIVLTSLGAGSAPDIVEPFHPLPDLLLEKQARNSPEGLLAIIRGACDSTPVIVLVKVEQERGMSFETVEDGDERRVEVVIEDGLVFTDKTDVFKAAIFYLDGGGDLAGYLTDDQTGSVYRGPASIYWLSDFLGCKYQIGPDVTTRAWIKATEQLVKRDIEDPAQKDRVLSAMLVELQANTNQIDPQGFIQTHVPDGVQDQAMTRLRENGAPTRRFAKSRDVSAQAPKRKKIFFDNEISVTMPADSIPDISKEQVGDEEVDVLTIRGRIRRVDT